MIWCRCRLVLAEKSQFPTSRAHTSFLPLSTAPRALPDFIMTAAPPNRLLTASQAAEYCALGVGSFAVNCPVRPKRVRPGLRGLR